MRRAFGGALGPLLLLNRHTAPSALQTLSEMDERRQHLDMKRHSDAPRMQRRPATQTAVLRPLSLHDRDALQRHSETKRYVEVQEDWFGQRLDEFVCAQ